MTNLGPLPTDFQEALDCARDVGNLYQFITSGGWGYWLQGTVAQTSCLPSGYNGDINQYYSPAQCPNGFTSACQSTLASETVITCCPTVSNYGCASAPTLGTLDWIWQSTLGCTMTLTTDRAYVFTQIWVGYGSTTTIQRSLTAGEVMNAYSVQVRFKSTDFGSTSTPTGSSAISTQDASATATTPPPPEPTADDAAAEHSSSASTITPTAAVGVAIGAIAGLLIVIGTIWYHIRRSAARRRRQALAYKQPFTSQYQHYGYPPCRYTGSSSEEQQMSISTDMGFTPSSPNELDAVMSPRELGATQKPQELGANTPQMR